jgi:hypothetical protein
VLLLPVVLLAVCCTIESGLASRAYLMLAEITLGSSTEAALLHKILVLFTLLCLLFIFVYLSNVLEPLLRSVMVPGVYKIDLISAYLLCW